MSGAEWIAVALVAANVAMWIWWHLQFGLLRRTACRWFGHPTECVVVCELPGCSCSYWFCARCSDLRAKEAA